MVRGRRRRCQDGLTDRGRDIQQHRDDPAGAGNQNRIHHRPQRVRAVRTGVRRRTGAGVDDESIEFYVYETSLDFGLVVDDRGCCLGAYDDSNNLRVTLVVEDPAAREWALDRFHRYREDATPLETVLSAPE
ncbi:transcriptional regulator FilR1 domain-containing protein [Halomicroarcula sp. GCM10025709]|uniref:transcriptional regulator FilR1 domain-containing protein n=1 Tax=Halomicroarcula sp. GCM10025709 TaxID=3252669 RepID=UPI00360BFFBD